MLGMIAIFVILFACVAKGISNYSYKVNAIERSRRRGNYETYHDINGMTRYQKNDKAIGTITDDNGDTLLWNPETGEIYENVSQKKREKLFKEGLKHAEGKMVPCSEPGELLRSKNGYPINGRKYINLENGYKYVKRHIRTLEDNADVFLNCKTNLFETINCDKLPVFCIRHNERRKRENFNKDSENWYNSFSVGF